jgi:1-acyl-sn-glycerol-3-phosphate acyltransferase
VFDMLQRTWRVLATGFAMACFLLGATLLVALVFPILSVRCEGREDRARRWIRRCFRIYLAMLSALGLIRLEVTGADRLAASRGKIIVANHPTLLDVVILVAFTPGARCLIKHELWEDRYLKGVVRAAGYIRNNLPPEAMISACRDALRQGNNLIVFPEGTRSRVGEPMRLHRGVANIAILTGTPIQLVVISCSPVTLTKGEPWYRIPPRRPRFRLEVAHPIEMERFIAFPHRSLGARRLMSELREFYTRRLAHG